VYSVPTVIKTKRLVLRRFDSSDLVPFTRLITNPEATRYLAFPDEMKTHKGAEQLLEETIQAYDTTEPLFALAVEEKATHNFVGCCGVNPLEEQTIEIFYAVVPKHWGRGIATEMAQALTSYFFDGSDVKVIKAFIVPGQEASKRVAEKVGFQDTGLVENPNFKEKVHQYELVKEGS
jgi:ribosomal-protein-alanine N-acetyltransferase